MFVFALFSKELELRKINSNFSLLLVGMRAWSTPLISAPRKQR